MVESTLGSRGLPSEQVPQDRSRLLPESKFLVSCPATCSERTCLLGSNNIWELTVPNPNQQNGSLSYYCHVGNIADDHIRTTFKLLVQILSEPAFNILRTQEQLGYIVFCSNWPGIESIGMRIVVQSSLPPRYLETRVEAFLAHMRGILENMSPEQFEEQKRGLVRRQLEKLKKLSDESARFWSHISTGYLDFTRMERDAQRLSTITKDDVLNLFKERIDPASPTRAKFSVHMVPQLPPTPKLSASASQAFLVELRDSGFEIDDEEYNGHCSEEPTIASVKEYFEKPLQEQLGEKAEALLSKLDELAQDYPAVGQGAIVLDPKVTFLDDGLAFRDSFQLSGTAKPVSSFENFLAKY